MRFDENINIAIVITIGASIILLFKGCFDYMGRSEVKTQLLLIMLAIFCIAYVLVVMVRYIIDKAARIRIKLEAMSKKHQKKSKNPYNKY